MHTKLKFIDVEGDAHTRGVQIGKASKQQITHSLSTYRQLFELCGISWHQAKAKAADYESLIESVNPELLEEVSGMAKGSDFSMADLLTLNCRTEILPADFLVKILAAASVPANNASLDANECTSFAVHHHPDSPVWLSQNWDWVGLQRSALIVVRAKTETEEQFITVTEAGMLAKIGLNHHGFGVCLNILRSHDDGKQPGLPVHFLLRALLDCGTVEQATSLASNAQYASSSNVMIADQSGDMANLELSPNGVQRLSAVDNTVCHTNHFLHPALAVKDAVQATNLSTTNRLETAQSRLSSTHDLKEIKSLLSDTSAGLNSICIFADTQLPLIAQIETVVGVVMNLSTMELWVSDAQPSVSDFQRYTF